MYVAGDPSPLLVALTCLGGYLSAGGAGAVNHWFDRDIDARMTRTANRPIPAGRVSPARRADVRLRARGALASLELSLTVNPLAASLSFAGFLGYVFVYTIWLKRRTPQNIVIGGAAGAVPPLVGWAAVTGSVSGTAVIAVLHRLLLDAAALLGAVAADEGRVRARSACRCCRSCAARPRRAGRSCCTRCSCTRSRSCRSAPAASATIYLVASLVLGLGFIAGAVRLYRRADRRSALRLYLFSLAYLALLFCAMVADVHL